MPTCCPGGVFDHFPGDALFVSLVFSICCPVSSDSFLVYSSFLMENLLGSSWERGHGRQIYYILCISKNIFSHVWQFYWFLDRRTHFLRTLKPVHRCFFVSTVAIKKCYTLLIPVFVDLLPPFPPPPAFFKNNPKEVLGFSFLALFISATMMNPWSGKKNMPFSYGKLSCVLWYSLPFYFLFSPSDPASESLWVRQDLLIYPLML